MISHLNLFSQKVLAFAIVVFTFVVFLNGSMMAQAVDEETGYTDNFQTERCTFIDDGENAYYILRPGYQMVFEGIEDGEHVLFVHHVRFK